MEALVILLSIIVAGVAKACMDTVAHHYEQSVFVHWDKGKVTPFWGPAHNTSQNKYADDQSTQRKKIKIGRWNTGINVPVLLTDGWHLFQSVMLSAMAVAVVVGAPICGIVLLDFILVRFLFGAAFTFFYVVVLIRKR